MPLVVARLFGSAALLFAVWLGAAAIASAVAGADDVRDDRLRSLVRSKDAIATIERLLASRPTWAGFRPSRPIGQRLSDERYFRLSEPFSYIDLRRIRWTVPKGYVTNGASVPERLQPFGLAPLHGEYVNASVLHDYLCDTRATARSQETHLLFYEGMRLNGVSLPKAGVMFEAVVLFGPWWNEVDRSSGRVCFDVMEAVFSRQVADIVGRVLDGELAPEAASQLLEALARSVPRRLPSRHCVPISTLPIDLLPDRKMLPPSL